MAANPGISEYMDAEYAAAGQARAGAMYWHYRKDDGYGLLAADGSPKPALLAAVARPYPARVAGEPGAWSSDGMVFTFTFTPDESVKAPTVIALPAGNFTATCEQCTATVRNGEVQVVAASSAAATVVVSRE